MPLEKQLRRLTQFIFGNQEYDFKRLFYGIQELLPGTRVRTSSFFQPHDQNVSISFSQQKHYQILRQCFHRIKNKEGNV